MFNQPKIILLIRQMDLTSYKKVSDGFMMPLATFKFKGLEQCEILMEIMSDCLRYK